MEGLMKYNVMDESKVFYSATFYKELNILNVEKSL